MSRLTYTVEAIAEEVGKSPDYVRALIRDNKLAAKRLGKTPLVLTDEFQEFLKSLPDA